MGLLRCCEGWFGRMRFHASGPIIPDALLENCDKGRVVFLCGAGVSMGSGMPSFTGLTQHVIDFFDPPVDSAIMRAFRPWLCDPDGANVPLDQIFHLLHQEYGRDEVNTLVTERLRAEKGNATAGHHHNLIKRISTSPNRIPQIVTTNFDLLFEQSGPVKTHNAPALPDLASGNSVEGITYLHGRLAEADAEQHPYVLSSADFGHAYLSEAWATGFIRNLLRHHTVVLVGYSAEDPPIRYLLQGLKHDGQHDPARLYAFDKGRPEEIEAKWRDRGATAIAYPDHDDLWQTMEAWAKRVDDPRAWRRAIIGTTPQDPKTLEPYQRGQVAHVLKTVPGAKLFEKADPPADPEWICVLSANVRSAEPVRRSWDSPEPFDPGAAYGLDDDRLHLTEDDARKGIRNDDLLSWRPGDEYPTDVHRLGGRANHRLPRRLVQLLSWIGKNISSPTVAWWAVNKRGLHSFLLDEIERQLHRDPELHDQARHIWNLILEHYKDPRNDKWDGGWYDFSRRVQKEGWTHGVLREFNRLAQPKLKIDLPYGLGRARPPEAYWQDIKFGDLGHFEVKLLERYKDNLSIPDDIVPQAFGILENALIAASGMIADVRPIFFSAPNCYPDREVAGEERDSDVADAFLLFIDLFDRLVRAEPKTAQGHVLTWPKHHRCFFRKLYLYALSKAELFSADQAVEYLLSQDQADFWDHEISREMIFLLVDRWAAISEDYRKRVVERLLSGPDKYDGWSDEKYPSIPDDTAARYTRYLELQGCNLPGDQSSRLANIIAGINGWRDGWAIFQFTENGVEGGPVQTDETPDQLVDLPIDKIVSVAAKGRQLGRDGLTEQKPFRGLVKTRPRKALLSLGMAARQGDFPASLWSDLINEMPEDISPRLKRVFLCRLTRLPHSTIAELRHTICRWLEQNLTNALEIDEELGWSVFDHVVDGIHSGGQGAAESGIREIRAGRKVVQPSRRTLDHALNGPLGMCSEALFHVVFDGKQKRDSPIPGHIKVRIERLMAALGEGADHAVSCTFRRLDWLMEIDPVWVEQRLIPMLEFEHELAEPAWNGFLYSRNGPSSFLTGMIKPLLLRSVHWVENQAWDRDKAIVPARWLGWKYFFKKGQSDGLTNREMRQVLRDMSDGTRNRFIFWLGKVGRKNENGWEALVVPFLKDVWPREIRYRTADSVWSWVGMLDNTGPSFPSVYQAVKPFLVPAETDRHSYFNFTRSDDEERPITEQFPSETLDLLNVVTPKVLTGSTYELSDMLSLIIETKTELETDPRYQRLIELVESS